jgi:hypothetical protein
MRAEQDALLFIVQIPYPREISLDKEMMRRGHNQDSSPPEEIVE